MQTLYEIILAATGTNGGSLGDKAKPIFEQFAEVAKIFFPVVFAAAAIAIISRLIFLSVKLSKIGDDAKLRKRAIIGIICCVIGLLLCIAFIASFATIFTAVTGQSAS